MEEEAVPEQARLHKMCREMPKGNNPERWDPVRNWLKQLNANLVYESVTFMGEYETTALVSSIGLVFDLFPRIKRVCTHVMMDGCVDLNLAYGL